jgi:carboxymethylenebutenolidase
MPHTQHRIPTPEGDLPVHAFRPQQDTGPWPAAILYMDAPAIRPALFEMAQRLADHGYYVVLPDLFWRAGPYEPMAARDRFRVEAARTAFFSQYMASTNQDKAMRDTQVLLDFLDRQPEVKGNSIGVFGYCMGGGMALRAAGHFPDRVVAAASFHGGNLATDAPDSPHLQAPNIHAKVLVAGADEDRSFDASQQQRLIQAFERAGVDADVKIYPGAKHGYAPPDTPVYDREASERHWRELTQLFATTLT